MFNSVNALFKYGKWKYPAKVKKEDGEYQPVW